MKIKTIFAFFLGLVMIPLVASAAPQSLDGVSGSYLRVFSGFFNVPLTVPWVVSTSTTQTNIFPRALFNQASSTEFCLIGDTCITVWPTGGGLSTTTPWTTGNIVLVNNDSSVTSTTSSSFLAGYATGTNMWAGSLGGNIYNLNSGNVGIGTTSPAVKLDVYGSSTIAYGTGQQFAVGRTIPSSTYKMHFYNSSVTDFTRLALFEGMTSGTNNVSSILTFKLTSSGNMSDGFGPGFIYAIQDNAGVENFIARTTGIRDGSDTSGKFTIDTSSGGSLTTKVTVLSGGNVGIGTTTPTSKLDVKGTAGTGTIFTVASSTGSSLFAIDYDGSTWFNGDAGTSGYVLKSNGTTGSPTWVATSSLGFSGGSGTVTSVDMTVPTGLTVSGNPITTSGTLALALAGGYNIPLTASTTNWNGFYDVPSTRITAGDALTWSGNTLNFDGGNTPGGILGGTWASPTLDDGIISTSSLTATGYDANDVLIASTTAAGGWTWVATSTLGISGGGSGDITSVGDVASGAAFDGTQGTTLTFNNAGGDGTLDYDGTDFTFSHAITAPTLDTGQGANELYDMDQNVLQASTPTFAGLTLTPLTSALLVTNGSGVLAEYGGSTCTNQVTKDLTALGASNCVSINNDYWSGTDLSVANGGTGASTLTDHGVLVGSGTSAIDALAVGTNGQLLIGSTGADPVFATLNCADGLTCTTGAGTLEIDLDTASSSKWTDAGAFTYLTSTTDDLVLGASATATAPFFWDVSATTTYQGVSGGAPSMRIGTSTATNRLAVSGTNDSVIVQVNFATTSAAVTASDTFIDFTTDEGSIGSVAGTAVAGTIIYNTFTGSHWSQIYDLKTAQELWKEKTGDDVGFLVKSTGEPTEKFKHLTKSELLCERGSKAVYGVYGGTDKDNNDTILSIGTGFMWVKNTGENLGTGDLLMSSDECGMAEIQKSHYPWWSGPLALLEFTDSSLSNRTAAKAMEDIEWEEGEEFRKVAVIYLGG